MNYLEIFKKDWRDDAEIASLCLAVYRFLSTAKHQDHYSYAQLKEATGTSNDNKLAQALLYLSNPRLNIVRFVFFVEHGDDMHEVFPNEAGELIDDFTGEMLDPHRLMTGFEVVAPSKRTPA
jgi:hypothetical protein